MPKPEFVANVSNQNLHALGNADMVIFAPRAYMAAAGRLADIHRNDAVDPMQVHVIDIESVFNEFGSQLRRKHRLPPPMPKASENQAHRRKASAAGVHT